MDMSQLPLVIITSNPYNCGKKKSYGIILRARNTGRFLVIQRRDDNTLVAICRGGYHKARIALILDSIPSEVMERVLSCYNDFDKFTELCQAVDDSPYDYVIEYAFKRVSGIIDLFKRELELRTTTTSRCEIVRYTWPKGSPFAQEKPLDTALRELLEETGINLSHTNYRQCETKIASSFFTLSNLRYNNEYFICEVDNELTACNNDVSEVSETRWMTLEEIVSHSLSGCDELVELFGR